LSSAIKRDAIIQSIKREINKKRSCRFENPIAAARRYQVIKHIVVWKLKDFAEGADKTRNAQIVKAELESLIKKIPQIKQLEVGINIIPSDAAFDVSLHSAFENEKDLDLYQKHPEHVKVAAIIAKLRESRVVIDYKVG
jgi:hypothetical protein